MKTLTHNGNTIVLYGNAKECPIKRYKELQKYQLLETGIGSSIEDIGTHFSKLHGFIAQGKTQEALKEAENLHYNHYAILHQENFTTYSFACLIHSINGIVCDDLSEDGLKIVIGILEEIQFPFAEAEEISSEVKKK